MKELKKKHRKDHRARSNPFDARDLNIDTYDHYIITQDIHTQQMCCDWCCGIGVYSDGTGPRCCACCCQGAEGGEGVHEGLLSANAREGVLQLDSGQGLVVDDDSCNCGCLDCLGSCCNGCAQALDGCEFSID